MSKEEPRKQRVLNQAVQVLSQIQTELELPMDEREGGISDSLLQQMQKVVLDLKAGFERNQMPQKHLRHRVMQRMLTDSWPWGTELGKKIVELEDLYVTLD